MKFRCHYYVRQCFEVVVEAHDESEAERLADKIFCEDGPGVRLVSEDVTDVEIEEAPSTAPPP